MSVWMLSVVGREMEMERDKYECVVQGLTTIFLYSSFSQQQQDRTKSSPVSHNNRQHNHSTTPDTSTTVNPMLVRWQEERNRSNLPITETLIGQAKGSGGGGGGGST